MNQMNQRSIVRLDVLHELEMRVLKARDEDPDDWLALGASIVALDVAVGDELATVQVSFNLPKATLRAFDLTPEAMLLDPAAAARRLRADLAMRPIVRLVIRRAGVHLPNGVEVPYASTKETT